MKREQQQQQLSALIDGELEPAALGPLIDRLAREPELAGCWERYHLISAVLHGEAVRHEARAIAPALSVRLATEPTVLAPRASRPPTAGPLIPLAGTALAASVAFLAVLAVPAFVVLQGVDREADDDPAVRSMAIADVSEATPGVVDRRLELMPSEYASRWHIDEPELESKLDRLLVTHQEYAPASGMKGLLPYATFVGYEAPR